MSGSLLAMALSVSWFRITVTFGNVSVHGHNSVIIIIIIIRIIMFWRWRERSKYGVQCIEEGTVCVGQCRDEALRWSGGRIRASVKWTFRFISGDKRHVFASVPSLPSLSLLLSLSLSPLSVSPLTPPPCFFAHSRFFLQCLSFLTKWYLVLFSSCSSLDSPWPVPHFTRKQYRSRHFLA